MEQQRHIVHTLDQIQWSRRAPRTSPGAKEVPSGGGLLAAISCVRAVGETGFGCTYLGIGDIFELSDSRVGVVQVAHKRASPRADGEVGRGHT